MLIAIDYDGTYTEDPALWQCIVLMMQRCRHEVICVTMRHEETETIERHNVPPCMIYYTGRKAKDVFCKSMGMHVDIWIDDHPRFVFTDAPSYV